MKKYFNTLKGFAFSGTAKDTFILFGGNVGSAFLGFLFTLIVARSLSVSDFGVFSAVLNLVVIFSSIADIGISAGSVNFIAYHSTRKEHEKVSEYIKASFLVRVGVLFILSLLVLPFARPISTLLLASSESKMAIWVVLISFFWFFDLFFPYILQAKKEFLSSVIYDNSYYLGRLIFALIFFVIGSLTIDKAFWAFGAGFLVTVILTQNFVKTKFLYSKPTSNEYRNLLKFSGWVGVNRIISSISGRLDIQMLAALSGAVATGLYSIPSRLATFIIVLSGSFSSVLATRLAGFNNFEKERSYIIKSTLALLPITALIILWIIIAKPFMLILFGSKYLESVPVFQALAASQIPFLFTVPAVSAIIYAMKKTVYIGTLSFFQLAAIFALNYYFIPKYGPIGPTITFGITNTLLALYVWFLVVRHYWIKRK